MKHLLFIFFSVASSVLSYGFDTEFELKWIPLDNAMYELTIIDSSMAFDELADPTVVLYDRYGGHHPQVSLAVIDSKHSITFSNIGIGKSTAKNTGFIDLKFLKLCEKKRADTTRYYAWDVDISDIYSVKKIYPIRLSSKKNKLELKTTDVELSNKIERYNATESLPESVAMLKEILFELKDEDPLPFLEHITGSLMGTVLSQQDSILLNYLSDLEAISVKIAELAVQKENPDKKILENLFLIIQWIKGSYFQASFYSDMVASHMTELETLLNDVYANTGDMNNEKNMRYLLDRLDQIFFKSTSSTINSKALTPLEKIQNNLSEQEIVVEMFWGNNESIYCFLIDHSEVRIFPLLPKKDLDSLFNEVDLTKPSQLSAIYLELSTKMSDFIRELCNYKRAYLKPIYLFHSLDVSNYFTLNGKRLFETMEIVNIKDYPTTINQTKMISTKKMNMVGDISYEESTLTKKEQPIFTIPIWSPSSGSITDTTITLAVYLKNLPYSSEERAFVQEEFPNANFLSQEFSEEEFSTFFNKASGLFIYSGHGFVMLNPRDKKRNFVTSGLLFSNIKLPGKDGYHPCYCEDGVLSYLEISKNLKNQELDVIILNACVASVGKMPSINYKPGSVATAFEGSAVNASIISSTSYVADEYGAMFTKNFLKNLKVKKDDLITSFFKAKRAVFHKLPESADISLTGNFILLY